MPIKMWCLPLMLVVLIVGRATNAQQVMEVVSSVEAGGNTPEQLVEMIIDQASGIQLVPGTVTIHINASGNPESNLRAMGRFSGGLTVPGTPLPDENQPPPPEPEATYSGGIGLGEGVVLCTGLASDNDPFVGPVPDELGVGVQGPNRGYPIEQEFSVIGEIDFDLERPGDQDFIDLVAAGLDATVLNFDIELQSPGVLQITYVHGTDEHPRFALEEFNDTFLVFVRNPDCPGGGDFENFIIFRELDPNTGEVEEKTLSLHDLDECGFLRENLVAPYPPELANSPHGDVETEDHFDHEFAGFSIPLTFEMISFVPTSPLYRKALAPGVYNVKIVIQDVGDQFLDSAAFIKAGGLKIFPLVPGDYNGDGCVDEKDYEIITENWGKSPATFFDGDGDGSCAVDGMDYVVWYDNLGNGGNGYFTADFNGDGCVDAADWTIWRDHLGMTKCASRFQGDANGDGAVDSEDEAIWQSQFGLCGGCPENASASLASLKAMLPRDPDVNGDGVVDEKDFAVITAIIEAWKAGDVSDGELTDSAGDESTEPMFDESFEPMPAEFVEPTDTLQQPVDPEFERSLLPPELRNR